MVRSLSRLRVTALAMVVLLVGASSLPAQVTIIDDGDANFSAPGWTAFAGQGHGGDLSFASAGNGSLVATWTFSGLTPGVYQVSATWVPHPNRVTDARYTILHGSQPIGSVTRNQEQAPDDLVDGTTAFENLGGPYNVTGSTLVVQLTNQSNQAGQMVIADAVRISRQAALPTAAEIEVYNGAASITDGSTAAINFGTTTVGTPISRTFTVRNVGGAALTLTQPITVPSGFTAGNFGSTSLAAGATTTFTVTRTATTPGTVSGQVSFANNDSNENPFNFQISGTVNQATTVNPAIIDNRDPGFSMLGNVWYLYGLGYNGDSFYAELIGGTNPVRGQWQATSLPAGSYTIQATWVADSAFNVAYQIYDGDTLRTTVLVDQRNNPTGPTFGGRPFQTLATVAVNGGTLRVVINSNTTGYVIADAIRYSAAIAQAPEIDVLDAGVSIPDNTGSVNFGTTVVGTPVSKTFTVRNTGTAPLTLQTTTLTAPAGFSVTAGFGSTTLAANTETQFTLQMTAATAGSFSGSFSFTNNDGNENPYNFTISGVVVAPGPEIQVLNGTANIADNSGTVAFGTTPVGMPVNRTLTVRNLGTTALTLTVPITITDVSGTNGFSVFQSFGTTTLQSGQATAFVIRMNATAAGTFSSTVSFANNDSDENPFNFTVSGTVAPAGPEIAVRDGTTDIPDNTGSVNFGTTQVGLPITKTFTIANTGSADLTLTAPASIPTGFSLVGTFPTLIPFNGTATFQIRLDAAAVGTPSGVLSFANNDSDENPFNFTISGTVNPRVIANIIDNNDPGFSTLTNFWFLYGLGYNGSGLYANPVGGEQTQRAQWQATELPAGSYTVQATWFFDSAFNVAYQIYDDQTLRQTVLVDQRNHPTGEVFGGRPFQTLATVRIDSGILRVVINSNTTGYVIADAIRYVTSVSTAPEIAVTDTTGPAGVNVADGGSVSFGTTTIGTPLTRTFTVRNDGSAPLTLQPITVTPTTGWSFTQPGSTTLAPAGQAGSSTTFTATLTAAAAGSFSSSLSFGNNDADENPFNFTITGTVNAATAPEITVLDGATNIPDNTGLVNFIPNPTLVGQPLTRTFTVRNDGSAPLTLQPISITPSTGWTFTTFGSTTLAPMGQAGSSTTFTVTLTAAAAGTFTSTLSFGNNDSDENPFNFQITGTVNAPAPEITVLDGAAVVFDGSATPINFTPNPTTVGTPVTRTFTVRNDGTANLTLQTISITPTTGWSFTTFGATTLVPAPGTPNSTTFSVTLTATAAGTFNATVSFGNNDANENPFDFTITGTVNPPAAPEITVLDGATSIPDNTGSVNLGTTTVGSPVNRVIMVRNDGSAPLTLVQPITLTPTTGFSVSSFGTTTVAPSSSTTFTVTLTAAAAGTFSSSLSFGNNDGDENPFNFQITGTVNAVAPNVVIVDDGDANFTLTPNGAPWTTVTGQGFGNDITTMTANNGNGSNFATWTFNGLTPGASYRVSATWTANTNRSVAAPYTVYDGPGGTTTPPPVTVHVNQQVAPNGFTDAGFMWENLTTVVISGSTLAVRLTDQTTGVIVADAVRVELVPIITATEPDAIRFLEQATFGPNQTAINRVQAIGFEAWLNEQFSLGRNGSNYDPLTVPLLAPLTNAVSTNTEVGCPTGTTIPNCVRDLYTPYLAQRQFYTVGMSGNDQLRQRVAFALHKLIVTNTGEITPSYRFLPYLAILDRHALGDGTNYVVAGQVFPRGNFRSLLMEMTLNPGMGDFLDMAGSTVTNPNENYAREIMQLFAIGLFRMNQDGSLILDGMGNPIDTYTQADVVGLARVFTGWNNAPRRAQDPTGTVNFFDPMLLGGNDTTFNQHDFAAKTFLGQTIPARTANVGNAYLDLIDGINIIFNNPNVGPFLSRSLIQMLVTSNPTSNYISRVTGVFNDNGLGVRGDMKSVIRAILLDPEARGDHKDANASAAFATYGKLREPIQWHLNMLRAYGTQSFDRTTTSDGVIAPLVGTQGQSAWAPPSVFSYFSPETRLPGSDTVLAPEFGILNTTSSFAKANFADTLVAPASTAVNVGITVSAPDRPNGTSLNLSFLEGLVPGADDTALLNELNRLLLHGRMSTDMRTSIQTALDNIDATALAAADKTRKKARSAYWLVVTSSQYQVQQ